MGGCENGCWRRGGDSNPRYGCPYAAFRVRCIRPLCHLSARARRGAPGVWSCASSGPEAQRQAVRRHGGPCPQHARRWAHRRSAAKAGPPWDRRWPVARALPDTRRRGLSPMPAEPRTRFHLTGRVTAARASGRPAVAASCVFDRHRAAALRRRPGLECESIGLAQAALVIEAGHFAHMPVPLIRNARTRGTCSPACPTPP